MATKSELLVQIDKECKQQGTGSGSNPHAILTDIVTNHSLNSVGAASIADLNTGTATTGQIATAVNSILAVLRTSGVILAP